MKTHKSIKRLISSLSKNEVAENRNLFIILCLLFSVLCILPGCAQQKSSMSDMAASDLSHDASKAEIMEITEDVLSRMHFEIDKINSGAGYIKTRPLEGGQFFELWRSDNVGAQNWLLGNLHSVRRTAEINIDNYIDCAVHIQRLSIPEQEITSSARAYAMFSRSSPGLQTLVLNPEQQQSMAWTDLGRDEELEREIVKRIFSTLDARRTTKKGNM